MADLKALVFDVDGTLANTERDGHRVAFNAAFAEAGLDWVWSPSLYGELLAVTGGKERIRYYLERYRPDFQPPPDLTGYIAQLHRSKTRHYVEMLETGAIPMRSGVVRLLREARAAGLKLAIATTTTPENVTTLLEHGIGPEAPGWFDVIAAGDMVAAKKPAPDVFELAMDRLGLVPAQCMAFEDSENGVKSVRGAGIRSLVVTVNDYTEHQDFSGVPLVLDRLGEPDVPCRVLRGRLDGVTYLDLKGLRALHRLVHADA